jgi:3-hydroxybutyrate dehydrogenase
LKEKGNMTLKGRTAIVTGSTSGIGLGIARALGAAGANLMLNGFGDAAQIETLRAGLAKEFGVKVAYSGADMSKPDQVHAMVKAAVDTLGSADILVNNAGIQHTAPTESFPPERWDAVIAINLSAVFHATQAVLPLMKARNWGRIINIASVHGLVASAEKVAYVAAKHGVIGMTKVVALETAKTGITCNAICPGWVLTPLVQKQIDDRAKREGIAAEQAKDELLAEKQPSGEFATPEQMGALCVFLCSDAAAQMRGVSLPVDGGWTAQ